MDRRVILAIVLMLIVAVVPSLLFPPKHPVAPKTPGVAPALPGAPEGTLAPGVAAPRPPSGLGTAVLAETVWVTSSHYRFGVSTRGGDLVGAQLLDFQSFAPGDNRAPVQLVPPDRPMLDARLIVGSDTLALADLDFAPSVPALTVTGDTSLVLVARRAGVDLRLTYGFAPDEYRFSVRGHVGGLGSTGAVLLLGLGDGLRSVEADSVDDARHYAVVTKAARTQSTGFAALKPGEEKVLDGPFEWVAVKSKYFLVSALALDSTEPQFAGSIAVGGPRPGKLATRAAVAVTLPVPPTGDFHYSVYAGPLEYRRLARIGHGLDDANPYGYGFLRPIIQPVSVFVVNVLLWMHERLHLAYGWVLIIFGVLVRLLLWPLNQRAMESSLRMQAAGPLIKAVQDRYKNDPERLQREMLKVYKDNQVNPFGGCLPMVLPMPVLFALFFVFANTIEFRGVPFLWLPDLSRSDPYYIIPIAMGLSMFVLSKVGQIGMPPNPQAATMLYMMPVVMTMLFMRFASGLNIYYAVSNLFSIPQQYSLARRRLRRQSRQSPG